MITPMHASDIFLGGSDTQYLRFQGYAIDMSLLQSRYPEREMIVQWGESDLFFIRRLLYEVGFRFRKHETAEEMAVIVFGD